MRQVSSFFFSILALSLISGSPRMVQPDREQPFAPVTMNSADSALATLSLTEKIDQLFVLREDVPGVGGNLLDFSAIMTMPEASNNKLRPLLLADLIQDDQLYQQLHLPQPPQLASVGDTQLIYTYGLHLGKVLQSYGIDAVIGPSLDLEYNDDSPLTGTRSFGYDPQVIAAVGSAYVQGLRTAGILCIAGSFPGIGNTTRGFDREPPMVYSKRSTLISVDMAPFKALVNEGLQGIFIAQAFVPGLDSSHQTTAAHSSIINENLRKQMGFNGILLADAFAPNEQDATYNLQQSVLSGNDLVITTLKQEDARHAIQLLIDQGALSEEMIDHRVKRILQVKLWSARDRRKVSTGVKEKRLYELEAKERQVFSQAMVLLENHESLPLQGLDTMKLAVVRLGDEENPALDALVSRYAPAQVFQVRYADPEAALAAYLERSSEFNHVLVIADETHRSLDRKRFGLSLHGASIIERIVASNPSSIIWNGNAKGIRFIQDHAHLKTLILGHASAPWSDDLSIQAFFGGRAIDGSLRRKIDDRYEDMKRLSTEKVRLAYGLPEEVGIQREDLKKIDSIARKGIDEMAYPGCQVWFAKDGVVVVNEAFGHHTYQQETPVLTTDLYDLASITKIAGSVAGLMKLNDEGSFDLNHSLCDYLGDWVDTTSYMQLSMREILAHQAGLTPFIPFYSKTITKGVPRYDVYSLAPSETYPLRVAREFYIRKDYPDHMFREILNYNLSPEKKYKYSDIGYYFALRIIERQSGMLMEDYLDAAYYKPLGLSTMGYRPLERVPKERIPPTEFDRYFRNQLIHGDVHDPGAAMLGGVGGHAGLFSNANDLGILMQMYLNGGTYGGEQYFSPDVIADYIRCQFCDNDNRRGAGFDKPLRDGKAGPSCGCTDLEAFGHQGFTGTVTWADPGEQVVYVFLSNRVYPDANNKKLLELNIRTDIQEVFYQAIGRGKELAVDTPSPQK